MSHQGDSRCLNRELACLGRGTRRVSTWDSPEVGDRRSEPCHHKRLRLRWIYGGCGRLLILSLVVVLHVSAGQGRGCGGLYGRPLTRQGRSFVASASPISLRSTLDPRASAALRTALRAGWRLPSLSLPHPRPHSRVQKPHPSRRSTQRPNRPACTTRRPDIREWRSRRTRVVDSAYVSGGLGVREWSTRCARVAGSACATGSTRRP